MTIARHNDWYVIQFQTQSLMELKVLEQIWYQIQGKIEEQGIKRLILDFQRVEFLSSQAVGIIMALHHQFSTDDESRLVLCSVRPNLMELLELVGLTAVLQIQPSLYALIRGLDAEQDLT